MNQQGYSNNQKQQGPLYDTDETPEIGKVSALWRFPVKGLPGQEITSVAVNKGGCFPLDRIYAIENGPSQFDKTAATHLPKTHFLNLMRDERLALLSINFDEETHDLSILRQGRQIARGNLKTSIGCNMIEQFIAAFMSQELKGPPRIQYADNHHFTDQAEPLVHIINLASVTALGHMINESIPSNRFRANIHLEGLDPWVEQQWIGDILVFDDVEIEIVSKTSRCAAINVDLETAKRGRSLPAALNQQFGHDNFGLYGRVLKDGDIKKGSIISKAVR